MIKLDNNYSLESDGFQGVSLVFQEQRTVKKLDKNRKETGEMKEELFKDAWYFNNPVQALNKYFELSQGTVELKDYEKYLKEISEKLNNIYEQFANVNWRL